MDLKNLHICCFLILLLSFLLSASSSSSLTISDDIFGSHASLGRTLLQAKAACPVNFEFKNYTIITSKCKGPSYPANLCCQAFKEFACPYAEYLNDLSNDCATTMFSYINLYGKYPPGLFASECRDDKLGLDCTAIAPSSRVTNGKMTNTNASPRMGSSSPLLITLAAAAALLLSFHRI